MGPFHEKLGGGKTFHQKSSRMGGGAHKMGGGQIISPKNGGSVDAIVNFWGECNSNVIFMEGVEIKLIDFAKSVVPFHENLGGGKIFHKKLPEWDYTLPKINQLNLHSPM